MVTRPFDVIDVKTNRPIWANQLLRYDDYVGLLTVNRILGDPVLALRPLDGLPDSTWGTAGIPDENDYYVYPVQGQPGQEDDTWRSQRFLLSKGALLALIRGLYSTRVQVGRYIEDITDLNGVSVNL